MFFKQNHWPAKCEYPKSRRTEIESTKTEAKKPKLQNISKKQKSEN